MKTGAELFEAYHKESDQSDTNSQLCARISIYRDSATSQQGTEQSFLKTIAKKLSE